MTRPVVMDVIARDKATKTYNNVGNSVNKLAKDTNKANDTIHRSAGKAASANESFAKRSGKAFATTSGHLRTLALFSAGAFATIGAGAFVAGKSFIDAAEKQGKANRQTAAVIKSTGGVANVTAKQVGILAGAISQQTGIQDDLIQSSANMLLTFKNVRNEAGKNNDIFNQATQVVTDMSVAIGQDSTKSAIQLGKALNDPIKGIGALQRVGVTFTDAQKKQIKTLVAHGNILAAQKIILGELTSEFGGSAAAQATAGEKMAAAWDNVKEAIGNVLLPVLEKVENWFVKTGLPAITRAVAATQAWIKAHWTQISDTFWTVWGVIRRTFDAWKSYVMFLYTVVLPAITNWVKAHWPQISAAFQKVWAQIKPTLLSLWQLLQTLWVNIIKPFVAWVQAHWHQISDVIKATAITVGIYLLIMNKAIQVLAKAITFMVKYVWAPQWRVMLAVVSGTSAVIIRIWNGMVVAWNHTFAAITVIGQGIVNYFIRLPGRLVAPFVNAGRWLYNAGKNVLQGFWNGLTYIWQKVTNFIGGIVGWIKDHKGPISLDKQLLYPAGKALMHGLVTGMMHGFTNVVKFVGGITGWLANQVGGGFGKDTGLINTIGVQQAVSRAMEITGVPSTWFDPLMRRIRFESGGNPMAINLTDINAQRGDPSRGLMQTIGATFRAFHHPGTSNNIYDPVANIAAAIDYIRSRYGSIFAIDPPIQGYEKGTRYVPQTGLALLHKGESVRTRAETASDLGGGDTYIHEVHVHGVQNTSQLWQELQKYAKRNGSIKLSGVTA